MTCTIYFNILLRFLTRIYNIISEYKSIINSISTILMFFYIDYSSLSFYHIYILINSLCIIYTMYIKYLDPEFIVRYHRVHQLLDIICIVLSIINIFISIYIVLFNSRPSSPNLGNNGGPSSQSSNGGPPGQGGNGGPSDHGVNNDANDGGFTGPNLNTIRAKIQWRWDNGHRSTPVFSRVPVNGFDSNITNEEMTFLSNKVLFHGLDESRPFGILRYTEGDRRGLFRVVLLRVNAEHVSVATTTPVRPSVQFRAYLDSLN